MQLLNFFNAFKVQKNKKIYKEDMNKGTLRSFFVWKYFFCINAKFKTLITFCFTGWRSFEDVNILHDITVSNKTNLTSAVPQFNQLLVFLLIYVKTSQIIPVIRIVELSKMMNVALRGLEIFL